MERAVKIIAAVAVAVGAPAVADTEFTLPDVSSAGGLRLAVGTPLLQASGSGTTYTTGLIRDGAQPEETASEEPYHDPYASPFATVHSGMYFRLSGLVVDQLNDVTNTETGARIPFNIGGGVTVAFGYRDFQIPIAFEVEYAYRNASAQEGGSLDLNTISANTLFDVSDVIGPIGFYAGGGIGVRIDQLAVASVGGQTAVAINGSGFFYQAMAGVTLSLHDQFQLYGGVRFTDAGTVEEDPYRFNSEALNYEFGLRYFF